MCLQSPPDLFGPAHPESAAWRGSSQPEIDWKAFRRGRRRKVVEFAGLGSMNFPRVLLGEFCRNPQIFLGVKTRLVIWKVRVPIDHWHRLHPVFFPLSKSPKLPGDVLWLQRDFSVYLVNMLGTQRIRQLQNQSYRGLYPTFMGVSFTIKSHKKCDCWRNFAPNFHPILEKAEVRYWLGHTCAAASRQEEIGTWFDIIWYTLTQKI